MKLAHLTAGTGNFHCGSCLRDHALVRALNQLGHQALMVPLYLPLVLDDSQPSGSDPAAPQTVYMGGINIYLQHTFPLFRRTPIWMDRLLNAPFLLNLAASRAAMTQAAQLGELTQSLLRTENGEQEKELTRLIAHLKSEAPDVVCLSNALLIGVVRRIKRELNVPVVCTLQGEDSFLDALPSPYRDHCWQELAMRAADVDAFVPVSHYYARVMHKRLHLTPGRIHVVHNGIDTDGLAPTKQPPSRPVIGFLARMCRGKGLHTLIEAFIMLKRRGRIENLRLRVAGAQTATDHTFVHQQIDKLKLRHLVADVDWLPNIDRTAKINFLQSLSVLSVPATYGESFGLYVIEALACGVPVVQPDHGAFGELLAATNGGILCRPDDPVDLADNLEKVLTNAQLQQSLGIRGRLAVLDHFAMENMGQKFAAVLDHVATVKA